MGCEEKYELTKKRCQGGIFLSEFEVFGREKRSYIESKNRSSEILGGKMELFSCKKIIRKCPPPKVGARSPPMHKMLVLQVRGCLDLAQLEFFKDLYPVSMPKWSP